MKPNLKNRLLKIRQSYAIWQCTVRRAPLWITPKNRPAYRPFILVVVDQDSEMILQTEVLNERPGPQAVLDHLFKTIQGNLLNLLNKQRPACISLDDAELARACSPQLAELGIRCEQRASLPQVNAALLEMETHIHKREPIPGLLSIHAVSVPLVAELYSAAAEYHRQAPWRWIQNTMPIEVHYPQSTGSFPAQGPVRYALVLGSGGEFFGMSLYESLADLDLVFSHTDPVQPINDPITWLSLVFEEATSLSFEDLDAIERYDWPVAGEKAYPLVIKTIQNKDFSQLPTPSDIAWLAAALRTIPTFVNQHLHADRGLPQPAQICFSLPNVHGNQHITLRYPVSAMPLAQQKGSVNPIGQSQDPDLEAYIADWHWDEKSHEIARQMGTFLFQFLDYLDESNLSGQTMRKHASNCWCIGWLESTYGDHDTFAATIFLGGPAFIGEFKRKVSDSNYALNSFKTTWRKLEKYIYSQGFEDPYME